MKSLFTLLFSLSLLSATAQQISWQRNFADRKAYSMLQTPDGGYVMTGQSLITPGQSLWQGMLLKTDSLGQPQWEQNYTPQNPFHYDQYTYKIIKINSGYIMTGGVSIDVGSGTFRYPLIMKTDLQGNQLWVRVFQYMYDEYSVESVVELPNGNLAFTGSDDLSPGWDKGFILLTDSAGNQIWQQNFAEPNYALWSQSIFQTPDSAFLITGRAKYMYSYPYISDRTWMAKVDWQGNLIWRKNNIIPVSNRITSSAALTPDGGIVLGGYSNWSAGNWIHPLLSKTDSAGNLLWSALLPDSGAIYDVVVSPAGDIYATGQAYNTPNNTGSAVALLKFNSSGTLLWKTSHAMSSYLESGNSVIIAADGGIAVGGESYHYDNATNNHVYEALLYKFDRTGQLLSTTVTSPSPQPRFFPNPISHQTTLALPAAWQSPQTRAMIYDRTGKAVAELTADARGQFHWQRNGVPAGMYFYRIITYDGRVRAVGKIVAE